MSKIEEKTIIQYAKEKKTDKKMASTILESIQLVGNHEQNIHQSKIDFEEHMRISTRALEKHIVSTEQAQVWGWLPKDWLGKINIKTTDYGLLTFLVLFASNIAYFENEQVILLSKKDMLSRLNIGHGYSEKSLNDSLKRLTEANIIVPCEEWFKLNRAPLMEYRNSGFVKVYVEPVRKILEHSKGLKSLTRIATYMAMRSNIFESATNSRVMVGRAPYKQHEMINMPKKTYINTLTWLFDKDILAWNQVIVNSTFHQKTFYFSEKHDVQDLLETINSNIRNERIVRIIA